MNKISIAAMFGRMEHRMGRWMFVPIIGSLYFTFHNNDYYGFYLTIVTFTYWIVYIFSHTFEKIFYGKGFRNKK
jgi:hypothetical protein